MKGEREREKKKEEKRLGLEWLIELEEAKLMREGGERVGNSISSPTPDVSMRFAPSFLFLFFPSNAFPFSEPTGNNNGRERERERNLSSDREIGKEGEPHRDEFAV